MNAWTGPPTLRGDHVLLRPLAEEDWSALARAHDAPDILEFFPFGPHSRPPTADTVALAVRDPDRQALLQIDRAGGTAVGTTSLYQRDEAKRQLTVGYTWLSAASRGGPLNAEAKLLLFRHAFTTLNAVRVQLHVDNLNHRSQGAVTALGARHEGILRKHARRRDGSWRDTYVYAVTDDDWPQVEQRIAAIVEERAARARVD